MDGSSFKDLGLLPEEAWTFDDLLGLLSAEYHREVAQLRAEVTCLKLALPDAMPHPDAGDIKAPHRRAGCARVCAAEVPPPPNPDPAGEMVSTHDPVEFGEWLSTEAQVETQGKKEIDSSRAADDRPAEQSATSLLKRTALTMLSGPSSEGSRDDHGSDRGPGRRPSDSSQKSGATESRFAFGTKGGRLYDLAMSRSFEMVSCTVILLNCATMGFQAHDAVAHSFSQGLKVSLTMCEHFFTSFFLFEFTLRMLVFGCRSLVPTTAQGRANLLDAFLAFVCGVIANWLIPLISFVFKVEVQGAFIRNLTLLRAVRLARIVRVIKTVPLFREAWMLIRGLSDSARTLLWTIVVIFLVTYTFAIFGLVLLDDPLRSELEQYTLLGSEDDVERLSYLLNLVDGLDKMMFTLVQVICQDSFHSFMRDILIYLPWSWVFFYAYMSVAVLVLMNLVTAVIVENAMETSRNDQEQQLTERKQKEEKEVSNLRRLFRVMDTDESGTLSWDEFRQSFEDPGIAARWMMLDFKPEDCRELFRVLDDGDGEIDTREFFKGLQKMRGPALSKDVFRLQKSLERLERGISHEGGGALTLPPEVSGMPSSSRGKQRC